MSTTIILSVVAVAGALAFALASNAKLARIGQLTFAVGLFWIVFVLIGAQHMGVIVPFVVAAAGALTFALSKDEKLVKIGDIALAVGLFWLVAMLSGVRVHF